MANNSLKHTFFVFVALSPFIVLAIIWPHLPAIVPTHFGIHGPDHYGPKSSLLYVGGFVSLITIGLYFLLQYIHKIDPKRSTGPLSPVFNKLAIGLVIFMSLLNITIMLMSFNKYHLDHVILPLVGLLLAFLGYIMHDIQPNYFAGIKLPWTLHSDYNWCKTHRVAGKVWGTGGLLLAVAGVLFTLSVTAVALPVLIGAMVIVPVAYSFILYKKEQKNPNLAAEDKTYNATTYSK